MVVVAVAPSLAAVAAGVPSKLIVTPRALGVVEQDLGTEVAESLILVGLAVLLAMEKVWLHPLDTV